MSTVLAALFLLWLAIGGFLTTVTLRYFRDPEKVETRRHLRSRTMDRFHTDCAEDFYQTPAGFLSVFLTVMTAWPWILVLMARDEQALPPT